MPSIPVYLFLDFSKFSPNSILSVTMSIFPFISFVFIILAILFAQISAVSWADDLSTTQCQGVFEFNISDIGKENAIFTIMMYFLLAFTNTSNIISDLDFTIGLTMDSIVPPWAPGDCRVSIDKIFCCCFDESLAILIITPYLWDWSYDWIDV